MRIIGGIFARRLIKPPKNLPVRPTTDLAKESLFNILNHKIVIENRDVLDLFSGTGSLAYEFASRGCKSVTAVESNFACVRFIKQTTQDFGMENIKVLKMDVFRFLKSTVAKFDIIFADPPYQLETIPEIHKLVVEKDLLRSGGLLIIEHPQAVDFSAAELFVEHCKYGHVNFSFFGK